MNKKIVILSVVSLFLAPFWSSAAIPLTNPGGVFNTAVSFSGVAGNVANFIIGFIAILGIIFLVYGGIQYVTSAGDEGKAEDAKSTITYALIGLFLAACAYALEKLVLQDFFV